MVEGGHGDGDGGSGGGGGGGGGRIKLTQDGRIYFKGQKKYGNGDVYDGEFVDGMKHGVGKLKFSNGDRYEGEFERNAFHGFGVYVWNTTIDLDHKVIAGKKYEGEWKDGKKYGKGVYWIGNGDVYSGMFVNDYYEGHGHLKQKSGEIQEGNWKRGKPYGKMKIQYANGDEYEGELLSGIYEGQGKLTYRNGLGSFDGHWHGGKPHGKGVRLYSDGGKYIGLFNDGTIEGEGMMFFANGDQYLGMWKNGYMNGKGVYNYMNGDSYEGSFMNGVRYGNGKYRYSDGGYYQGEYVNTQQSNGAMAAGSLPLCDGLRHGVGVRVWTTGARYEGQWMEDKIHGAGVLTNPMGAKYEGLFYNGLRNGKGTEQFGNTVGEPFQCALGCKHAGAGYCTYTGQYQRGVFHGIGEFQCQLGVYYKGHWKLGKKHGQGEQYFIKNGEIGDAHNMFIGGLDSLYRMKSYKGEFVEDIRQGNGVLTYTNGDTVDGQFLNGHPHGTMVYTFASNASTKVAQYRNGYRIKWVEVKRASISRSFFSSGLNRNSSRSPSRSPSISPSRSSSISPGRPSISERRRSRTGSMSGKGSIIRRGSATPPKTR